MERPIYPSEYMRITQGYNEGTHLDSFAIDEAGKDTAISNFKAPFTGIIKKIYAPGANEIWLESKEPVEYPDGTIDYMTIMLGHANDISNLYIGKTISKGDVLYSEGTKGNATGNHCHIECARGKYVEPGWYKNNSGYYGIINGKKPEECLWIDKSINIIDSHGYIFKTIEEQIKEEVPVLDDNTNSSTEDIEDDKKQRKIELIFISNKTDLYGIYLKEGQKLYLE